MIKLKITEDDRPLFKSKSNNFDTIVKDFDKLKTKIKGGFF